MKTTHEATVSKGSAIFAICVLAGAITACRVQPKADEAASGPKVQEDKVTFPLGSKQAESFIVESVVARKSRLTQLTGHLAWDDDVTVRIFSPVSGRVISVPGQVGQKVRKDDVLAQIASPEFWQAQTDARRAASEMALSEKTMTRLRELLAHGAAAQKDLEAAETDFIQKTSEKERALALLDLYGGKSAATNQMHSYSMQALLEGTIVERNLTPGQQVRPDTQLGNAPNIFAPYFVVSDPTRLWVWVDVNENGVADLRTGQTMRVSSPACPGRSFEARVDLVADSLDPSTRMVKVRGLVANPEKLLKAEMYVNVDIDEQQPPGFEIPGKAVFLDLKDGEHYLFVEEEPGVYSRKRIKIGGEQNGRISVLEGLREGQKVVIGGALLLKSIHEGGSAAS